jgi:hypothetical protein
VTLGAPQQSLSLLHPSESRPIQQCPPRHSETLKSRRSTKFVCVLTHELSVVHAPPIGTPQTIRPPVDVHVSPPQQSLELAHVPPGAMQQMPPLHADVVHSRPSVQLIPGGDPQWPPTHRTDAP